MNPRSPAGTPNSGSARQASSHSSLPATTPLPRIRGGLAGLSPRRGTVTAQAGWVRPRFSDGTFDDSLPLEDHFRERFLSGDPQPTQLALIGERGSGLTSTLSFLRGMVEESEGYSALSLEGLLTAPDEGLNDLEEGRGVLFLDTSVTPIAPRAWRMTRALFSDGVPGHAHSAEVLRRARLVVARPGERDGTRREWPGGLSNPSRAYLAPWGSDELLELLSSRADYRERRTEIFAALSTLDPELLRRPRTTRWLVEAALRLRPGEPIVLTSLLDQILAVLGPWSRRALAGLERGSLGPAGLQALLCRPPARLEEASTLFEIPRALAHVLRDPAHDLVERAVKLGFLRPETLDWAREHQAQSPDRSLVAVLLELGVLSPGKLLALSGQVQPDLGCGSRVETRARLALPGLEHRLAARHCAAAVARDEAPTRIDPEWLPYLRADLGPDAQRQLVGWLRDPSSEWEPPFATPTAPRRRVTRSRPPLPRDAAAATLLWVCGVTPPLDAKVRSLDLRSSSLAGLSFPGVVLRDSDLSHADLGQARLEGSDLTRARLRGTRLRNAALDGADLQQAVLIQADLRRASLRGVHFEGARLTRVDLSHASLEGARAGGSWLHACVLSGARLERSELDGAHLVECVLDEARLDSASLRGARLLRLDLRQTGLTKVDLSEATLTRCALAHRDLREVSAHRLRVNRCDLSGVDFYGADLHRASFQDCFLRGVRLRRADLRGVAFLRVRFGEAEGDRPAADLRDADLRGANLLGTDLEGVDLRGARLDDRLRSVAKRMGAWL
jgi:uncharacterized protein YjbI with pentapeptide repeats